MNTMSRLCKNAVGLLLRQGKGRYVRGLYALYEVVGYSGKSGPFYMVLRSEKKLVNTNVVK
ncbi:hypothetical protein [Peribacillus simplex]|nr:hypothetical protein [Peribacillus simplex]